MRSAAVAFMLCAVLSAAAEANPSGGDWAYISFDPNGDINSNELTPDPYTTVNSYVVGHFMWEGELGWTTISFRLNDLLADCPGVMATQAFVNLLPGDLSIGDPFSTPGITIASTECLQSWEPIVIGYVSSFYLGGSCTITILDNTDYPRWVCDCQDPAQVFYYDPVGEGYIVAGNPVEDMSWGGIKSLYR
jgi:hypothetical protein